MSRNGLVLTNHHVVDLTELKNQLTIEQADFARQGRERNLRVLEDRYLLLFSERDEPPVARFTAELLGEDPGLDLAVLRVAWGSRGQPLTRPVEDLDFVPLGDSDAVQRGDRVHVFGYPAIASGVLAYTEGGISSWTFEPGVQGRAWILSDATVSGGNSGGAAVDDAGLLVGIPTLAGTPECVPGDTNGDGATNEFDVGCMPVGGSFARLRPVNLAKPLLSRIAPELGSPPPAAASTATAAPPTETPAPSPTTTPVPEPTPLPSPIVTATPTPAGIGRLAYAARTNDQWDIHAYDVASGTITQLTTSPADEVAPAYSHAGDAIAFVSDADGSKQVWVMNSDGSDQRQVTGGVVAVGYVAWSVDDRTVIVTASDPVLGGRLATVAVTGGPLQPFGVAPAGFASVASNGHLAFTTRGDGGSLDIGLVRPDGEFIMVAATGEEEDAPNISPDGEWVAYQIGEKGSRHIEIASIAGGTPRVVPWISGDDSNPVWSPDGAAIAHVATSGVRDNVWIVPLDGAPPIQLDLGAPDAIWYLAWGP